MKFSGLFQPMCAACFMGMVVINMNSNNYLGAIGWCMVVIGMFWVENCLEQIKQLTHDKAIISRKAYQERMEHSDTRAKLKYMEEEVKRLRSAVKDYECKLTERLDGFRKD